MYVCIIYLLLFLLLCRRFRMFQSMTKSLNLLLGCPGDLPTAILSLDNLQPPFFHMLVLFSSSFHPLINRFDTAGFSDLLASYSILLCPGTATIAEKTYKEPLKMTNEAMVTHKPG